jgi:hypothetical protein
MANLPDPPDADIVEDLPAEFTGLGVYYTKEKIVDKIQSLLISKENLLIEGNVQDYQKTVRDGKVVRGRLPDEKAVIFSSDLLSNVDDLPIFETIQALLHPNGTNNPATISLNDLTIESHVIPSTGETAYNMRLGDVPIDLDGKALDNFNQYLQLPSGKTFINDLNVDGIIDTDIYELIPGGTESRQTRIDRLFAEYNALKPPSPVDEEVLVDGDGDGLTDTVRSAGATMYSARYDISAADSVADANSRFITWLREDEDNVNNTKSLEWLRNDLNNNYFLQEDPSMEDTDERPEYEPVSEGYFKIRQLNQAIIIRNELGSDVGFIGNDPSSPDYLKKGVTIAMWVKFLDRVNTGTLFNFGNPFRQNGPAGFALETFVVNADGSIPGYYEAFTDDEGWDLEMIPEDAFTKGSSERFVRFIVYEEPVSDPLEGTTYGTRLRDSNKPNIMARQNSAQLGGALTLQREVAWNYTRIPFDYDEWYYIVGNYNPYADEEESAGNSNAMDPDFWNWYRDLDGTYTTFSGFGAKCKVDFISKTKLLKARGYKVDTKLGRQYSSQREYLRASDMQQEQEQDTTGMTE